MVMQENAFESAVWKIAAILYRPQCVNFAGVDMPSYCALWWIMFR